MYLLNIKAYILIGLFCFISSNFYAQDQALADSLINLYKSGTFKDGEMELLRKITKNESNPEINLVYSDLLIKNAVKDSSFYYLQSAYLEKGNAYKIKGDNTKALEAFFKSLEYANRIDFKKGIGSLFSSIADTYSIMDNSTNAEIYYDKGIAILREVNDSIQLATVLLNAGDEYFNTKKYNKALAYFNESGTIFNNINYPIGIAYNKGNTGMVYAELGKDDLALTNINEAVAVLEELQDYYPISVYLTYMADIYANKNDLKTAIIYGDRSLALATQYDLKDQISDANLKLHELNDSLGNSSEALSYYKEHIVYRDLIKNIENVQQTANMRTEYEVSEEKAKVTILEEKRKNQRILFWATVGVLFLIGVLAYGLFKRNKFVRATNKIIASEKERSDNLLLNILPEETAQELKDKGSVEAKKYESTTVLFSDFKGFTSYAENLSPEVLVKTIDHYFSNFDLIMEKHGLEKIKTIGDAYMAAGGLSYDDENYAKQMILAAKEMNEFVTKAKLDDITTATFDIRIGINTGPVVAGVVGTKKFAYDIWGDTVNIASRMESNSEPARINISENTYEIVKSDFDCEYRGEIAVKNRGHMKMYFVNC